MDQSMAGMSAMFGLFGLVMMVAYLAPALELQGHDLPESPWLTP